MEGRREFPVLMWSLRVLGIAAFGGAALIAAARSEAAEPGADVPSDDPPVLEEVLLPVEPERRIVDLDALDTENFEIGVWGGSLSVQDFGVDMLYGAQLTYHLTEDLFVTGRYAQSRLGETSFEVLSGGFRLLTDDERDVTLYDLSVGWNILPGEVFVTSRWALAGALYLEAGAGSTEFAGDANFTITLGAGYRMLANDFLAMHIGLRDYIFNTDLLGVDKTTHNLAVTGGFTVFF